MHFDVNWINGVQYGRYVVSMRNLNMQTTVDPNKKASLTQEYHHFIYLPILIARWSVIRTGQSQVKVRIFKSSYRIPD